MSNFYTRTGLAMLGLWLLLMIATTYTITADNPTSLPRLSLDDLHYEGAFRLPADTFGASSLNYSQGPIAYNAAAHSLYIVGHSHDQAIAEFALPPLVNSAIITDLNMATAPLQPFSTVIDRAATGNPQAIDRIGGLAYIDTADTPFLLINGYEYYDADVDVTHSTLVARAPAALDTAAIDGFYAFAGGAGHTSGWLSPIPAAWQAALGGRYITGSSSGIPIISRTSVGPSAFVFDPDQFETGTAGTISTTKLLDFSLENRLHSDLDNAAGDNDLWTHLSRAVYGLIVPGTRTYLTIGQSAGHESGVCYKCVQDDGNLCGGYCPPDSNDYYHYYWLWDVDDLVAVKNGVLAAHDVRPYEYGRFPTPFATRALGGGSYDPASGILYMTVQEADRAQGEYANPPVVVAYSFDFDTDSTAPSLSVQLHSETAVQHRYIGVILLLVGLLLLVILRTAKR